MESKVETDKTILNNKQDIINSDNEKWKKETEKFWNMKTFQQKYSVYRHKNTRDRGNCNHLKIIQQLPEKHNIKELQKTAHILLEVLL